MATMPPTLPEPDALDQIRLGSTGSGVAQPLSPPATVCHMLRGICRRRRAAEAAVARPAIRRAVLLVAEDVVRDLVVDGDVIHLRVGQPVAIPGPAAIVRDREALVVADDHPVARWSDRSTCRDDRRRGSRTLLLADERLAAVERLAVARRQEIGFVLVVGRHEDVRVVVRAAHGVAVVADHAPLVAAVVGPPHLAAIGLLPFHGMPSPVSIIA